MKIEVKNFGPIKKGTIDLDKRVTVFVGYNNSGKTYMSQLLWGLNSNRYSFGKNLSTAISVDLIKENLLEINKNIISQLLLEFNYKLPKVILPEWFNVSKEYFNKNFSISFPNDLLERFKEKQLKVINVINDDKSPFYHIGYMIFNKASNSLVISSKTVFFERPLDTKSYNEIFSQILVETNQPETWFFEHGIPKINEAFTSVVTTFLKKIIFCNDYLSFFLPANRVFYPTYYKYIYSVAKDEKDMINERLQISPNNVASLQSLSKRPYTQPVDFLIDAMYRVSNGLSETNFYTDLLSDLKNIIGGDIVGKQSEGYAPIEFYLKLEGGEEIEMYLSSSSANQLTTMYLYLKYWAQEKDNFLIIDEPEENLHPNHQINLVNILMKFADRANNKILINTHSPLITDHINNYANLSYLKEQNVDTAALVKESTSHMADVENIKHGDYGVYFFNGGVNHKGESIEEYSSGDYGVYFRDFQTAQNKVKDIADILKDNIYDILHPHA